MKRRIAIIAAALSVALPVAAFPIFGGIPVFDAGNLAESLIHTTKWSQQIQQMITTYNRITQQYNHAVQQAKYITNMVRYRIPATVWRGVSAADSTGRLGGWIGAVNSGIAAVDGWKRATMERLPVIVNSFPAPHRPRLETEIATLDLQDANGISAIDTLGRIRLAGPQIESALNMLESDSLSTAPDMHTEAAQMNKANALSIVQTRALADQNKLLVTNTELALARLKQERDAGVARLRVEAAFRNEGKAALEGYHGDFSAGMLQYRIP